MGGEVVKQSVELRSLYHAIAVEIISASATSKQLYKDHRRGATIEDFTASIMK